MRELRVRMKGALMEGIGGHSGANRRTLVPTIAVAAFLVAAATSDVHACVGSGLLIPVSAGLLFLNLGIALVEALVARLVFKVSFGRAYWIMVLANYASLAAGLPLVMPATTALEPVIFFGPRLLYLRNLARLAVGVTYVLTIALEMPFGYWLMKDRKRRFLSAVAFVFASRTLIYLLLPLQAMVVGGALRDVETVLTDTRATRNPSAVVYYLDNERGDLWSMRLDGTQKRLVAESSCRDEFAFLVPSWDEAGAFTLKSYVREWKSKALVERVIYKGQTIGPKEALAAVSAKWADAVENQWECGVDLRMPGTCVGQRYKVVKGGWSLHVYPVEKWPKGGVFDDSISVHYQTPFDVKDWHAVSRLDNDECVAQIDGQIVLVDIKERAIAFLAEGHSPLVVPEGTSATSVAKGEGPESTPSNTHAE